MICATPAVALWTVKSSVRTRPACAPERSSFAINAAVARLNQNAPYSDAAGGGDLLLSACANLVAALGAILPAINGSFNLIFPQGSGFNRNEWPPATNGSPN